VGCGALKGVAELSGNGAPGMNMMGIQIIRTCGTAWPVMAVRRPRAAHRAGLAGEIPRRADLARLEDHPRALILGRPPILLIAEQLLFEDRLELLDLFGREVVFLGLPALAGVAVADLLVEARPAPRTAARARSRPPAA